MGEEKDQLTKFKEAFAAELDGINDIETLKDLYATELARRDQLIAQLQEQNQLLLNSMVKNTNDNINTSKQARRLGTTTPK